MYKTASSSASSLLKATRSKLFSSSISRTFSSSTANSSRTFSSAAARSFRSSVPRWSHRVDWRSPLSLSAQIRAVASVLERFHRNIATMANENPFKGNLTSLLKPSGGEFGKFYSLPSLNDPRVDRLPYSIRILLESAIRNCDNFQVTKEDVEKIIDWENTSSKQVEIPFKPARVLLQVNLEYLGRVVFNNEGLLYPDSVVGTDSHRTMIDGLGVAGWGVGGIEAEAAMLGQPMSMVLPGVVGFKLSGKLRNGVTATDLVLTVTHILRKHGVVGKFVEFYGDGMGELSLADRATIANMSPEYGATMGFFPVDHVTLQYLKLTGRSDETVAMIESYLRANKMFIDYNEPQQDRVYSSYLELNLSDVEPCISGPKRPHDWVPLKEMKADWHACLDNKIGFKIYKAPGRDTIVLARAGYGNGSSRVWAAKGPMLLGVNALMAKSIERSVNADTLKLTGQKRFISDAPNTISETKPYGFRPLSPHLPLYQPQLSSTLSIFNRISGAFLTSVVLLFYMIYMKMGLISLSFDSFYQFVFYSSKLNLLAVEISAIALSYHLYSAIRHLAH